MKPNRVRGSAFDEGFAKEPASMNIMDNLLDDLTGFRLVSDAPLQVYRGGSWRGYQEDAGTPFRNWDHLTRRASSLGFRLVREDT